MRSIWINLRIIREKEKLKKRDEVEDAWKSGESGGDFGLSVSVCECGNGVHDSMQSCDGYLIMILAYGAQ